MPLLSRLLQRRESTPTLHYTENRTAIGDDADQDYSLVDRGLDVSVDLDLTFGQCHPVLRKDDFWMETIKHTGISPFLNDSSYSVYRNVKDFGAKGDGKTDDTAAIQAAIDGTFCIYSMSMRDVLLLTMSISWRTLPLGVRSRRSSRKDAQARPHLLSLRHLQDLTHPQQLHLHSASRQPAGQARPQSRQELLRPLSPGHIPFSNHFAIPHDHQPVLPSPQLRVRHH